MIVISGALVVVAIVLLIIGLISGTLGFIYASIAGSVVAFIFLIVGVMQRRGEEVPAPAAGAPALASSGDVEGVTAIIPAGSRPLPSDGAAPRSRDTAAAAPAAVSGSVLVVEGRPRYHVAGCRYLTGKDADEVPVDKARSDGFTACGVCKPDEALATSAAAAPVPAPVGASDAADEASEPVAAARETSRQAPSRPAAKTATKTAAKKAAPAKTATKTAAKKAPAKKAAKAPAKKAATRR